MSGKKERKSLDCSGLNDLGMCVNRPKPKSVMSQG